MADRSFSASVHTTTSPTVTYQSSAHLKAFDIDAAYTSSAVLVAKPQCQAPPAVILPTLVGLNMHFDGGGSQSTDVALLPTLVSLNIQAESC